MPEIPPNCPHCGARLTGEDGFCPECGAQIKKGIKIPGQGIGLTPEQMAEHIHQLKDYILKCKEKGAPIAWIKSQLIEAGWPTELVQPFLKESEVPPKKEVEVPAPARSLPNLTPQEIVAIIPPQGEDTWERRERIKSEDKTSKRLMGWLLLFFGLAIFWATKDSSWGIVGGFMVLVGLYYTWPIWVILLIALVVILYLAQLIFGVWFLSAILR